MSRRRPRPRCSVPGEPFAGGWGVNRSTLPYRPKPMPEGKRLLEAEIVRVSFEYPLLGYKKLAAKLRSLGCKTNKKMVQRVRREEGLQPPSPPLQAAAGAVYGTAAEGCPPQPRLGLGLRQRLHPERRQAQSLQSDRRVHQGKPLHPRRPRHQGLRRAGPAAESDRRAWGPRMHSLGQRPRVHRQGHPAMAERQWHQDSLHRSRMPVAERVRRELQQPIQGGVPGPRADIHAQRIASGLLGLERLLQQAAPAQIPRLDNPKRVRHKANRRSFPLRSPYGLPTPEGDKQQHQPRKPCRESLIRTELNSGVQAKDWDEIEKYRKFREDNRIELIPFKHYEQP